MNIQHISFNRYIVECKFSNNAGSYNELKCFNRYIVECKLTNTATSLQAVTVLIDT